VGDAPRARYLVIGCGNDLRSDDRAGREVARRIEALDIDGVTVRSVTQLVPELAVDVAHADHVVVVDASVDVDELTVSELDVDEHKPASGSTTHHVTPASLVRLARMLDGLPPTSVTIVAVPAHDLGFGEMMSPSTSTAVDESVTLITHLVTTP
jgi:hydrogenase maturation protease